jgi:hypothetical protein
MEEMRGLNRCELTWFPSSRLAGRTDPGRKEDRTESLWRQDCCVEDIGRNGDDLCRRIGDSISISRRWS